MVIGHPILSIVPCVENLHPLERWILQDAPIVKATRERFHIFQKYIQNNLKNNINLASVPCGVMDDLSTLDYDSCLGVSVTGIDLDSESLELAAKNATINGIKNTYFLQKNAWHLNLPEQFDIIASNGLNIYEQDDAKVIQLYKEFFKVLKSNGSLVTSFVTPPPTPADCGIWVHYKMQDLIKQKAIFSDILQVNWQSFRTEEQTKSQLLEAGFSGIEFTYDVQRMFPMVVAHKA